MGTGHFKLDDLPPRLRAQAERQLGLSKDIPSPVPTPDPTIDSFQVPRRNRGGLFKANLLQKRVESSQTPVHPPSSKGRDITKKGVLRKASRKRKYLTPDMAETLVKSCKVGEDGLSVRFVLGCSPYMIPTAQEKKIGSIGGKPRLFKLPKVQKAEKTITLAMQPYAHHFKDWKNCPVGVWMDFCYEYQKGTPKKNLIDHRYSLQKNDVDNTFKGLGDSLTDAGFWDDDNKIAELHLRKFRVVTEPRIEITIRKLPQVADFNDLFREEKL